MNFFPHVSDGSCLILLLFYLSLLLYSLLLLDPLLLFHNEHVLIHAVHHVLSHLLIGVLTELIVFAILIEVPVKRRLYSVAIAQVVLLCKHDSCCFALVLLTLELAGVVAELVGLFGEELGEDARPVVPFMGERVLIAIHEHVFLATVSMHIYEGHNVAFLGFWLIGILFFPGH